MDTFGLLQILLYLAVLLALVKPLGWYMARVYEGIGAAGEHCRSGIDETHGLLSG